MEQPRQTALRWTRRAFLGSLLAPLGYVGYRVAAHNRWIIVTRGRRAFDAGIEPKPAKRNGAFSMLVVGDTGEDTLKRTAVVEAMRKHAAWSRPNAAMLLGDNFYESGVDSIDDPRFDSDFEALFDVDSFDIPFYVCLGNHDVGGDAEAQVQYTNRSRRWKMPARYFRTRETAGDQTIDIFVLDTNTLLTDSAEADQQMRWFRDELSTSDADYKLVVGHHPAVTGGQHEVAERIGRVLPPVFEEFDVDVYFSGHDHDLQLLQSDAGWLQVVSGAGAKLRSTTWVDETMFAEATPGFCWLLVDEHALSLSYYDTDERLFTHNVPKVTSNRASESLAASVLH
ncbi:metallophosphoesterase [Crateriforma conspicua]|uniref:Calcineurin-like phosphoesterase n=1 Tax=Crateriforma conspicua TaxID=2527996 RepID=A0A5C5YAP4_9PLAN|nr:metallophosphoesterase [Crateriforma conspicua]TWT71471.1 Calcineurin-like phosphoesterase [Crateriforma conspicua]